MRGGSLQVGIIGAGKNTLEHHIPKLQAVSGVAVVGVCNRTRASGDRVAQAVGIPQVYDEWRELVADDAIDAVVIGTWPYTHCEMTVVALEAGKHVLCEARMAMNAEEAHRMLAVSREHPDLVAQLVPSPLTLTHDRTVRRLVATGRLGDVLAIEVRGMSDRFVDVIAPLTWRQDRALSGLNAMALGIWYEALARWVGHAESVMAMSRVCVKERRNEAGDLVKVEVPDHVDVLAAMDCGAQASLHFSEVTGRAISPWSVWLFGSQATLCIDAQRDELQMAGRNHPTFERVAPPKKERGAWRVEEEFVAAIRGEEVVALTTFAEGVRYMEFTEAVARSAESGRRIFLPLGLPAADSDDSKRPPA